MKTTIEIPEPLYTRAKIRAVETGQTLRQLVLSSLERELGEAETDDESAASYWKNRRLRPGFRRLLETGGLANGPSSTMIISEDRAARDDGIG